MMFKKKNLGLLYNWLQMSPKLKVYIKYNSTQILFYHLEG